MARENRQARIVTRRRPVAREELAAWAATSASLTARGRCQAVAAARELAAEPITQVYTSTALRARQTADLLANTLGVPITAMPELVEVGVGKHEGTGDPAVRAEIVAVLRAWIVGQDLDQRLSDGETGRQVVTRMTAAFETIVRANPGDTVAVVGHVASLSVALGRLCALGPWVWGVPLPYARPFLVEWDGHIWRCSTWPGLG
jgi:broad specificity phosphatase PhoE